MKEQSLCILPLAEEHLPEVVFLPCLQELSVA